MFLQLFLAVVLLLFYLVKRRFSYWQRLGVAGPKPIPLIGNIGKNIIAKKTIGEIFSDIYKEYEGHAFVGIYRSITPSLLIRDTDLIKNVVVKDFKYFVDNDNFVDKHVDPLLGRNPFFLKGEEWKSTRSQLTSSFTSMKMKAVFPLVENISKNLIKYIRKLEDKENVDAKELCTRFTCDNVAVCAFGIEGKSLDEADAEFRQLAEKFISPDSWQGVIFSMSVVIPTIIKLFTLKLIPRDVEERLIAIVKATIQYREENGIESNDFLDHLKQLSKTIPSFTIVDIAAHAAGFFADGFETSSVAMSFILFDLAMNQECQTKLRDEINSVLENHNGALTYEALQEMVYLSACVNESLRLHPPLPFLSKTCTQRYTMAGRSGSKDLSINLDPGSTIILPALGLQMDPKHFPEPEKFYPERFLNKDNINKYAYLPFGEGPRSCLGQRFGLLQVKIGIAQVIKHFDISISKKMQLPLKYIPFYLFLFPKGGFWLKFHEV